MPFIQEQNEIRDDYKILKNKPRAVIVWRSKATRGILLLLLFAVVVPVLIYYFVIDKGTFPEDPSRTCGVERSYRIDCGQKLNATYDECVKINCCFDNSTGTCFHYLPSTYYYSRDGDGYKRSLEKSPFGRSLSDKVFLSVNDVDENTVQIILHDADITVSQNQLETKNYNYKVNEDPLSFELTRNDSSVLLTTAKGPLIISENYWEWSFQLTEEYLFGLGQTLIKLEENSTLTRVVYGNDKDHTTLPVFLAYSHEKYHGLVVRHSGPLELTVLASNLVSLKSLAGSKIILEVSVGPTLQEVLNQQQPKKVSVDLNLLGVHVCREGPSTSLKEILDNYVDEKTGDNENTAFPYEYDCLHENLMIALLKSGNKQENIDRLIDNIKSNIMDKGKRFALALPPQVPIQSTLYSNAKSSDVFFKNKTEDYKGTYLDMDVAYPYFNHSSISEYVNLLEAEVKSYFQDVKVDAYILSHNWPSDDSFTMDETSDFQYLSEELIDAMSSTLPYHVTTQSQPHFLNHNDYGHQQLQQLESVFPNIPFMTASHSPDNLQPLVVQNIDISWTNLRKSISTILYNSISGHPLTSIPVCGSTSTFNSSHESLCLRWYFMSATAPIFRISSDVPRRDPITLGSTITKYLEQKARWAIDFRYSLRYYFYTVLSQGEPLMRPMFYDFPNDNDTFGLVEQYMVGAGLLVVQPTLPAQTQLSVYLPPEAGTWFEFQGGASFDGGTINLNIVESDWVGFVKGGVVIPLVDQDNAVTLKIALSCGDGSCKASGSLYIVGFIFDFVSDEEQLTVTNKEAISGPANSKNFVLKRIQVYQSQRRLVTLKAIEGEEKNIVDVSACTFDINNLNFSC